MTPILTPNALFQLQARKYGLCPNHHLQTRFDEPDLSICDSCNGHTLMWCAGCNEVVPEYMRCTQVGGFCMECCMEHGCDGKERWPGSTSDKCPDCGIYPCDNFCACNDCWPDDPCTCGDHITDEDEL